MLIFDKVEEGDSHFDSFFAILKELPDLKELTDELGKAVSEIRKQ